VYAASLLLRPVYEVRPDLLTASPSLLVPPGAGAAAAWGVGVFLAVWLVESTFYRIVLGVSWEKARIESLRSYTPLLFLWAFGLLFFPALPGTPMVGWWLLLDADPWTITLLVGIAIHGKFSFVARHGSVIPWMRAIAQSRASTLIFAIVLFSILAAWTPSRRFSEPYDARWGTGDEPRYVRIAASLLYDGDADVTNAAEHVGGRPEVAGFVPRVARWPVAALRTAGEVVSSLRTDLPGEASSLGGQVIRGRDGGTYYVYLPGFPLLLIPAMALDRFFFPGRLPLVLVTCLILGVLAACTIQRLVEPYLRRRIDSYSMIAVVSLTLPMFFYNFQIFPEMTAALCLALMLLTLLEESPGVARVVAFTLAASLLPWLHTRYYPVLGVCLLALAYRGWRGRADRSLCKATLWMLAVPVVSVALQSLYIFHITGSLLPDSLWVLNGYPRGGHLLNPGVLSGLHYLLVGHEEGLLVYAPLYLLALPRALALARKSSFAAGLSLAVVLPYLWISASHDQGGAGGWSPATRYLVPVTPVLALWLAAWLERNDTRPARWSVFFVGAAASFWIAQGMLVERNFPYDRRAFLSSGVVDVSAVLGWVLFYPAFLLLALAFASYWARRTTESNLSGFAGGIVTLVLVMGATAQLLIPREAWVGASTPPGATRLRPGRTTLLGLSACARGSQRLRFQATAEPHALEVRGYGFSRHLVVPSSGETDLEVAVAPVRRIGKESEEIAIVQLELEAGQTPVVVEPFCR